MTVKSGGIPVRKWGKIAFPFRPIQLNYMKYILFIGFIRENPLFPLPPFREILLLSPPSAAAPKMLP
jgi:hypothetical protein